MINTDNIPTVYVDMDDVMCAFSNAFYEHIKICPEIKYPQSQYGFFRNLDPIDGAIDGFNFLNRNCNAYIASAPSICNPLSYTEKAIWIQNHFDKKVLNNLILITDKSLLSGDYLIDDRTNSNNQYLFEGTLINFGSEKWKTWNDIVYYFRDTYNFK